MKNLTLDDREVRTISVSILREQHMCHFNYAVWSDTNKPLDWEDLASMTDLYFDLLISMHEEEYPELAQEDTDM